MDYSLFKTVIFAGLLFLAGCREKEQARESSVQLQEEELPGDEELYAEGQENAPYADQNTASFPHPSPVLQEQVNHLLDNYLELKKSLVESSAENASKAAGKLETTLDKETETNIPEDQQAFYQERVNDMKKHVDYIAQTKELEDQREHFSVITKHIYELSKGFDAHQKALYYQYCPMAFENSGGYWLSDSKEILNPYFGEKMLKCGQVREEIGN